MHHKAGSSLRHGEAVSGSGPVNGLSEPVDIGSDEVHDTQAK